MATEPDSAGRARDEASKYDYASEAVERKIFWENAEDLLGL